jgi:hypothetical protein
MYIATEEIADNSSLKYAIYLGNHDFPVQFINPGTNFVHYVEPANQAMV